MRAASLRSFSNVCFSFRGRSFNRRSGNSGQGSRFTTAVNALSSNDLKVPGFEVSRQTRPVNDEDVDRVLEQLRENSASLQPVEDRGAEVGDTVTANFLGKFVNDPEAEPSMLRRLMWCSAAMGWYRR